MAEEGSLRDFILRKNREVLLCAIGILVIQFTVIKFLYPSANLMPDSHYYVEAAMNNMELCAWPIGYSKFLEWVHIFVHRDWAVVSLQYFFLESAVLYFYFSIKYLLSPGKWVSRLVLLSLLMNPFILCMSNYILSDSLFAALSLMWFTLIMWHLHTPRPFYVYLLMILMPLVFSIRYSAIIYPVIAVPIILRSKIGWRSKLSGLTLACLLWGGLIWYTGTLYEKLIGRRDFSPFSGWQLAGNALIMYRHVPNREADIPPIELQPLHREVLTVLHTIPPPDKLPDRLLKTFFSWFPSSPLMRYSHLNFWETPTVADLQKWASLGKLYHDYGIFLIKRHPIEFVHYYIGQGIDWYFNPIVDIPNVYPEGKVQIRDKEKTWFGYQSNWIKYTKLTLYSLSYFPAIVTTLNILLVLSIICYFSYGIYITAGKFINSIVILISAFWLINFMFCVVSAPFVLRYALFSMILAIALMPIIFERIYLHLLHTLVWFKRGHVMLFIFDIIFAASVGAALINGSSR